MLIAPGLVFLLSRPDRRDMEMHAHVHSVAVSRAAVSLHTKKEQLLIGFLQLYMASSHCGKPKAQSSTAKMRKIFFTYRGKEIIKSLPKQWNPQTKEPWEVHLAGGVCMYSYVEGHS